MTEQVSPLVTFYKPGWENYQQAVIKTIAPLSSEQLALSLGPHQRSIGERAFPGSRNAWTGKFLYLVSIYDPHTFTQTEQALSKDDWWYANIDQRPAQERGLLWNAKASGTTL